MGIDRESNIAADLQIGPTSLGMVRIYVAGNGFELPLDFEPDEALEIAEEIRLAAERAREMGGSKPGKGSGPRPGGAGGKAPPKGGRRP